LFFFQAEDGIRDFHVTGVQTCALPISPDSVPRGTHRVTARLYADDGSVWAVDGEPVESTADVTVSEPQASASAPPTATRTAAPADAEADGDAGAGRAR